MSQLHQPGSYRSPEAVRVQVGGSQNIPDLQQCWFLGYHRDIGGGQKKDSLAQLALIWMISKLNAYLRFGFTPI